jgi:hypothetical protein
MKIHSERLKRSGVMRVLIRLKMQSKTKDTASPACGQVTNKRRPEHVDISIGQAVIAQEELQDSQEALLKL